MTSCTSGAPSGAGHPATGQAFSSGSPWNVPIPAHPRLDRQSKDMVRALRDAGSPSALLYEYGVPIYEADPATPRVTVKCTTHGWGRCPLEAQPVPIPLDAEPSGGSDGAMVVIDRGSGRVYDFWRASRTSAQSWTVAWGTWAAVDGDGIGGESGGADGGATGAGVNLLAGVVRLSEIRSGRIDHAMSFASSLSCSAAYRYPATKTDGEVSRDSTCLPEGLRVQLDPSIDVSKIPGITPGEVAVARALQAYGAYLRDSAAAPMAFAFERPTGAADPYPEAGFPWDYYDMPHIPWDRLRVLAGWDGR